MIFITLIALPIPLPFSAYRCQEHRSEEWKAGQCSQAPQSASASCDRILGSSHRDRWQYSCSFILAGLNLFLISFTLGLENKLLCWFEATYTLWTLHRAHCSISDNNHPWRNRAGWDLPATWWFFLEPSWTLMLHLAINVLWGSKTVNLNR